MDSWAKGIETVTLFVEDLASTRKFYEDVFGFPIIYEDADSTVFNFGGIQVNLLKISEADELVTPALVASQDSGSRFVFTIMVEDVDAICIELAARGVTLLNGPMDRPWGIRTASFVDPAGYIWEVAK
jgi:catechol 2,3-dioxygenase-like lactoylglutathione lyase family enzyme